MPAALRFFRKDPNKKGRGRGIYYHRGNGYYSKYSIKKDAQKKSKGYRTHKTGVTKSGKASSIPHTSDGRIGR